MKTPMARDASRRAMQAAALAGVGLTLLAACNSDDDDARHNFAVTLEVSTFVTVSATA